MSNAGGRKTGCTEKHYGFQNFNLVRRIAREMLVNGYRGYHEFIDLPGNTDSTYNDRVEKVYRALETCMSWPDHGRRSMWTDEMRISENPLYALFKTRSMTGRSQYALHFAMLDILSDGEYHSLVDIHRQIIGSGEDFATPQEKERLLSLIEDHINAGHLKLSRDGACSLAEGVRARIQGTNHARSMAPFIRVLSGRKKLSRDDLVQALMDDARRRQCYGLIYFGQKNQISQRLDGYYCPMGILTKDGKKGYSLANASIADLLDQYDALGDAIAFFSEYSPLGVVGSYLMDEYRIENERFVFKNQHIFQALDSIVLCDVFDAIARRSRIEIHTEQFSDYVPEVVTVCPICILTSCSDGRQFIYAYAPRKRSYICIRLDYVYEIAPAPDPEPYDEKIALDGLERLKHAWGASTGAHPFRVRACFRYDRRFVGKKLSRERRIGVVRETAPGEAVFEADVFRPRDMVPWLLTYMGKLTDLSVDSNARGERDTSRMLNRMRDHIDDLYRLYHGLARLRLNETSGYCPVPKERLDYLDGLKDNPELFQPVYSKYVHCMGAILDRSAGHHSVGAIEAIIREEKHRHHISPLDREITFDRLFMDEACEGWGMLQQYNEHQRLIGRDANPQYAEECCSFLVRQSRVTPLPLTSLQARWLFAILEDAKIGLFLDQDQISAIRARIESMGFAGAPLYRQADMRYLDRDCDGDDIGDPRYLSVFRTLLRTLRDNAKEVRIEYRSEKDREKERPSATYYIRPFRLEYSKLSDKFQVLGMLTRLPPPGSSLIERSDTGLFSARLSNIESAAIEDGARDMRKPEFAEPMCSEPIVIRILNIYGAQDRFHMAFSPYSKITEFEGERQFVCSDGKTYSVDSCVTTIFYARRDEKEIINRLRSFGRAIEVISPARVRQDFIRRVDEQYRLFVESGFMKPIDPSRE